MSTQAFAYFYVNFIENTDIGIVFVSRESDEKQFMEISKAAKRMKYYMKDSGVIDGILLASECCPIEVRSVYSPVMQLSSDRNNLYSPRDQRDPRTA